MGFPPARRTIFFLSVVLAEVVLVALLVAAGSWFDREGRAAGPESPFVAYSTALGREDLSAALDQLVPELRPAARTFVEWQLGNRYTILESAVRADSLLDLFTGTGKGATRVIVTIEVESEGIPLWRTTDEIPVQFLGDRWFLLKVPLQPTS